MKSGLLSKNSIKRILIIRNDNIGDLICTTPAIQAIRKKFKNAVISILVNRYNKDIIEGSGIADECFVYDKLKHGRHKSRLSAWLEIYRTFSKIRKREFDLVISCRSSYSPSVARMAYFTGARWRLGYVPQKGMLPRFFYNIPVVAEKKPLHEVDKVYRLVASLGIENDNEGLAINIPEAEKNRAWGFLKENSVKKDDYLAAIHISSRRPENIWPIERFIKIINFLISKGIKIVVLWMPGDEANPMHPGDDKKAESIKEKVRGDVILYKTESVKELIGELSLCKLVICLDGGAMHIAAALKIPVIALFGSTDLVAWGPYGKGHTVIKKENGIESISAKDVMDVINTKLPKRSLEKGRMVVN
jgi:ADP-heptose:LPS heptosyltransferase